MRRGIVGGAGLLALALTFGRDTKAANALFEFQTIEVPGAVMTIAWGINPQGDIVGQYRDAGGRFHGYLLGRDGRLTTIDYPGAAWTDARGINANGDVVGSYSSRPAGPGAINEVHGYMRKVDPQTGEAAFYPVDAPFSNSIAQRITSAGLIVGCHHTDNTAAMYGLLWRGADIEETDLEMSMHNGASPDGGRIVGFYTPMGGATRSYVIERGRPTVEFQVLAGATTTAWDMNPRGEIVGAYADGGASYGFLRLDGPRPRYVRIQIEGASDTRALGINPGGDVVGRYTLGGRIFGFVGLRAYRLEPASVDE